MDMFDYIAEQLNQLAMEKKDLTAVAMFNCIQNAKRKYHEDSSSQTYDTSFLDNVVSCNDL